MYEFACEPKSTCNNDQYSFKAYLARWLSQSAIVAPYIADSLWPLLFRSATAAAETCTGGENGITCGQKWYVGGYDGSYGIGQQLSALETVQSLLLLRGNVEGMKRYPVTSDNVVIEVATPSTFSIPTRTAGSPAEDAEGEAESSGANAGLRESLEPGVGTWFRLALPVLGAMAFGGCLVR